VVNADEFLAERRIAVLATVDPDGSPHLVAIWFEWADGAFLFPTGSTSRKTRNARARPRGAIVVDARGPRPRGVAASGSLEVLEGADALAINERIHRRYVTDEGMADPGLGGLLSDADDVTLRLVPQRLSPFDLEPVFGGRMADPRLTRPLAD
jgi:PPOX class probable F420-dependent enzyme